IQICEVGTTQLGSSSVPAATNTYCGAESGCCHSRVPHLAQRLISIWRPLSAVRIQEFVSPPSSLSASLGALIIRRFGAPVSFGQSTEWQALSASGRAFSV